MGTHFSVGQLCKQVPGQEESLRSGTGRLSGRMSGGGAGWEISGFADLQKHYLMLSPGKLQNES